MTEIQRNLLKNQTYSSYLLKKAKTNFQKVLSCIVIV